MTAEESVREIMRLTDSVKYTPYTYERVRQVLRAAEREARARAIEEAATIADDWAAQYPVDVFPQHKEAGFARHVAASIAKDVRALAAERGNDNA